MGAHIRFLLASEAASHQFARMCEQNWKRRAPVKRLPGKPVKVAFDSMSHWLN
jgi:hypothetical protein